MSSENMIESSVYRQVDPDLYTFTPVALIVITGDAAIRHHAGRADDSVDCTVEDKILAGQLLEQLRTAKAGKPTLEVAKHHGLWELAERISDDEELQATNRWIEGIVADRFGHLSDEDQGKYKNGMQAALDALARDASVRADRLRDRLLYRHDSVLVGAA